MAPLPSMFGGRDSSVTTCSWRSCSSAASSIVTIRSSFGMNDGEDVQGRGLAGAGAAGDEDVQAGFHAGAQEVEHLGRGGPEADQVVHGEGRGGELPDRDHGADERQRRDDGVDARAVGQTGVDHRAGLVDAATDRGDDPVDDPHHVVVVLEDDVGELELAGTFDVDLARPVDHDFGDGLITEERLQRTETDDLVGDLLEHPDALGAGQGEAFLVDDLAEDLLDLAPHLDLVGQVELGVQVLDDPVLDPELDVPERLPRRCLAGQPGRRGGGRAAHLPAPPAGWNRAPRAGPPGPRWTPVEHSRSASGGTSPTPLLAPGGSLRP